MTFHNITKSSELITDLENFEASELGFNLINYCLTDSPAESPAEFMLPVQQPTPIIDSTLPVQSVSSVRGRGRRPLKTQTKSRKTPISKKITTTQNTPNLLQTEVGLFSKLPNGTYKLHPTVNTQSMLPTSNVVQQNYSYSNFNIPNVSRQPVMSSLLASDQQVCMDNQGIVQYQKCVVATAAAATTTTTLTFNNTSTTTATLSMMTATTTTTSTSTTPATPTMPIHNQHQMSTLTRPNSIHLQSYEQHFTASSLGTIDDGTTNNSQSTVVTVTPQILQYLQNPIEYQQQQNYNQHYQQQIAEQQYLNKPNNRIDLDFHNNMYT
jgi:hypothetical protein